MAVSHSTHAVTPEAVRSSFAHVLHADGPDAARARELALYAWIVGAWDMDVTTMLEDGTSSRSPARAIGTARLFLQGVGLVRHGANTPHGCPILDRVSNVTDAHFTGFSAISLTSTADSVMLILTSSEVQIVCLPERMTPRTIYVPPATSL